MNKAATILLKIGIAVGYTAMVYLIASIAAEKTVEKLKKEMIREKEVIIIEKNI